MEKILEKGSEEWQFCSDYWKFRQQYYEAESEDWLNEILDKESKKLYEKYKDTKMCDYVKEILLVHNIDVEKRWYSGQNRKNTQGSLYFVNN